MRFFGHCSGRMLLGATAVAGAIAVTGCGGASEDAEQVQSALEGDGIAEVTEVYSVTEAVCPDDLELSSGTEFSCELTLEDTEGGGEESATLDMTQSGDPNVVSFEFAESSDVALEGDFGDLNLDDGSVVQ